MKIDAPCSMNDFIVWSRDKKKQLPHNVDWLRVVPDLEGKVHCDALEASQHSLALLAREIE